jgi:hypothetical protein
VKCAAGSGLLLYGSCRFTLEREPELADQANSSHEPQAILVESDKRVATARMTRLYVLLSFIWVYQMSFRFIKRNGVYGEVAARQIRFVRESPKATESGRRLSE